MCKQTKEFSPSPRSANKQIEIINRSIFLYYLFLCRHRVQQRLPVGGFENANVHNYAVVDQKETSVRL